MRLNPVLPSPPAVSLSTTNTQTVDLTLMHNAGGTGAAQRVSKPTGNGSLDTLCSVETRPLTTDASQEATLEAARSMILAGQGCEDVAGKLGLPTHGKAYDALETFAVEHVGKPRYVTSSWAATHIANELGLKSYKPAYKEFIRFANQEGNAAKNAFWASKKSAEAVRTDPVADDAGDVMTLSDGSRVSKPVFVTVSMNLTQFLDRADVGAVCELYDTCRGEGHVMSAQAAELAEACGLVARGTMHADTRKIILATLHDNDLLNNS